MKCLLSTCFLPLAVIFSLHTGTPVIIEKPDTVTIHSTGTNNVVVIDSLQRNDCFNEPIGTAVKGEITQTGENNRVEINTGAEEPKNKHQITINKSQTNSKIPTNNKQITNKLQKPKTKNQTEPATCNMQHVTIKQTGKNNSIKINSR
jgi:hypothetical protein